MLDDRLALRLIREREWIARLDNGVAKFNLVDGKVSKDEQEWLNLNATLLAAMQIKDANPVTSVSDLRRVEADSVRRHAEKSRKVKK